MPSSDVMERINDNLAIILTVSEPARDFVQQLFFKDQDVPITKYEEFLTYNEKIKELRPPNMEQCSITRGIFLGDHLYDDAIYDFIMSQFPFHL